MVACQLGFDSCLRICDSLAQVSSLFDPYTFSGFLQALRKAAAAADNGIALAGSKAKPARESKKGGARKKRKGRGAGKEEEEEEEEEVGKGEDHAEDSDGAEAGTCVKAAGGATEDAGALCMESLGNLLTFIKGFGLKEYPEMLNLLVETCVDITRTGGGSAATGRAGSSRGGSARAGVWGRGETTMRAKHTEDCYMRKGAAPCPHLPPSCAGEVGELNLAWLCGAQNCLEGPAGAAPTCQKPRLWAGARRMWVPLRKEQQEVHSRHALPWGAPAEGLHVWGASWLSQMPLHGSGRRAVPPILTLAAVQACPQAAWAAVLLWKPPWGLPAPHTPTPPCRPQAPCLRQATW